MGLATTVSANYFAIPCARALTYMIQRADIHERLLGQIIAFAVAGGVGPDGIGKSARRKKYFRRFRAAATVSPKSAAPPDARRAARPSIGSDQFRGPIPTGGGKLFGNLDSSSSSRR